MKIFDFIFYFVTFNCLLIVDIIEFTFTSSIASVYIFYFVVYCLFLALLCLLLWILRIEVTDNFEFFKGYFLGLDIFRLGYSRIISEWIGVLLHKGWIFSLWDLLWDLGVVLNHFGLVLEVFKAWGRLWDGSLVNYSLMSLGMNRRLMLKVYLAFIFLVDFLIDLLIIGLIVLKDE